MIGNKKKKEITREYGKNKKKYVVDN